MAPAFEAYPAGRLLLSAILSRINGAAASSSRFEVEPSPTCSTMTAPRVQHLARRLGQRLRSDEVESFSADLELYSYSPRDLAGSPPGRGLLLAADDAFFRLGDFSTSARDLRPCRSLWIFVTGMQGVEENGARLPFARGAVPTAHLRSLHRELYLWTDSNLCKSRRHLFGGYSTSSRHGRDPRSLLFANNYSTAALRDRGFRSTDPLVMARSSEIVVFKRTFARSGLFQGPKDPFILAVVEDLLLTNIEWVIRTWGRMNKRQRTAFVQKGSGALYGVCCGLLAYMKKRSELKATKRARELNVPAAAVSEFNNAADEQKAKKRDFKIGLRLMKRLLTT